MYKTWLLYQVNHTRRLKLANDNIHFFKYKKIFHHFLGKTKKEQFVKFFFHVVMYSQRFMSSGSHTMGKARCLSFRQRIYDAEFKETHYDKYKRYTTFRRILRSICPESGKDNTVAPLDFMTPARFDNHYFINILQGNGLLGSDNVLVFQDHTGEIVKQVLAYASDEKLFFASFANSIVKMGNINVLTGTQGEIRKNCRFVNT